MKAEVHELVLSRVLDAPPGLVWKAWTEPKHLLNWFVPKPWSLVDCTIDLRAGGKFYTLMQSPEGEKFPNHGVYLEVVPQRKLVFTDAYVEAWTPSAKPFMTAIVTFEPQGSKTKYTAKAMHWTAEDRIAHEKMGFHDGWGKAADQLSDLLKTL